MSDAIFGLFLIFGSFGTILTVAGWIADNHGDWLDRIPFLTEWED
jgi:hypothetical protein